MNIAIGTLSLHKKNMKEASALKVREYVAYGLPVILGYIDSDLDGCDFILNVGNYERNIHDNLKKIKEFIRFWKDKEIKYDMKHMTCIIKRVNVLIF
ncbi:hypothetical protein [sulfur-oxidizing endosymbiont of Gigantopelta aegis]|uniref:hypothetical protein n=1 Tax=sulfur-oxidizing endosymbiont of Gigantopelta aegis TaxID=2794934 RepID=UPI0018DE295F|nr:hypothetical protein [sulfur-oxidizing endosymbiont of Gigantopelta aegis]